jgi:hypothetical protein
MRSQTVDWAFSQHHRLRSTNITVNPNDEPEKSLAVNPHTLVVLNPGHFHAALTLRKSHPRLSNDVYVYAEDGPEVESFLRIVQTFNARAQDPTRWNLRVYRGADYLQRLRSERPGDVVIIAGRNDTRMQSIHLLHADGFLVLGDKPWLIAADQISMLEETAAAPPLAWDIMTERHEIANACSSSLHSRSSGRFRTDRASRRSDARRSPPVQGRQPAAAGAAVLVLDTAIQGEGITDVTTHLVDLTQWLVGGGSGQITVATWSFFGAPVATAVPRDVFERITGLRISKSARTSAEPSAIFATHSLLSPGGVPSGSSRCGTCHSGGRRRYHTIARDPGRPDRRTRAGQRIPHRAHDSPRQPRR